MKEIVFGLTFVFGFVQVLCYDPNSFRDYLKLNRLKQCYIREDETRMPLSFFSTPDYWASIPLSERIPPQRSYTSPQMVPNCNHQIIQPEALNAYEFQTETFLATLGLNIYDGAIHSIASAILGDVDEVIGYETSIISPGKTCQFGDIRADAPCKGVINQAECQDTDEGGGCGFCYGTGSNTDRTLQRENAWSFRMLSDYWALEGTIDQRCPNLGKLWTWNDYRPVLGENAWAFLTGPLQVAFIKYGSVAAIPDNDISITMALNFLASLPKMITSVGAVAYSPKNTISWQNWDTGFDVSTENNVSLLAGLKMLRYILTQKNILPDKVAIIDQLMNSILGYIKTSYDPSLGYFRQGGSFDNNTETWSWHSGETSFAVDCQTWTISVLGQGLIDSWFGAGTTIKIWETAKKLGGFHYSPWSQEVEGMGFTLNSEYQVFSGEWTLGAINMLRIVAQSLSNSTMIKEANIMRDSISQLLTHSETIDGQQVTGVNYSNKRYFIPFGWWANPILSTASTGWAVLVDSNFNPFYLGGKYLTHY